MAQQRSEGGGALLGRPIVHSPGQVTVAQYLESWLQSASLSLRPKTQRQYEQIARQHIGPTIGELMLADLQPDHIQSLYSAKLEHGASPSTVRILHAVLHRALSRAVRWGLIDRNPTDAVDRPRLRRKEMKTLTAEQVRCLLAAARASRLETVLCLAVTTGLRQGELLGLRWSDLDWRTGHLRVQRQVQRIGGQGLVFGEPKSASGRRVVVLGPAMIGRLRTYQERQALEKIVAGGRWQENGLVFPSTIGTPMEARNLVRSFKALLKEAGLPEIRFHDLRHTAATLMLQEGVHPKIVQERLGHSQISLTLDIYSHVLPTMQEEAARKLDSLLEASVEAY